MLISKAVDEVLDWPINHLSPYSLTLENNTPYFKGVKNKVFQKPKDQDVAQHFIMLQKAIKSSVNWQRYEISNYAKMTVTLSTIPPIG